MSNGDVRFFSFFASFNKDELGLPISCRMNVVSFYRFYFVFMENQTI